MKADRREELKHNELADWLGERLEAIQPQAGPILLAAALIVAAILGGFWYLGGSERASAESWAKFFKAFNERDPGKNLEDIAKANPQSKAGLWAIQSLGDMNLGQGAALLYSDRQEAQKLLKKAEESYKQLEAAAASDKVVLQRARLGLAEVYEAQCKPDEARKYYEMVAQAERESAIGKAASAGAARMKDPRDVAFLEWFAQQQPKRPAPLPGLGGGFPGLPKDMPERADIGLPPLEFGNLGTGTPPPPVSAPTTTGESPSATPSAKSEGTKSDAASPEVPNNPDAKSSESSTPPKADSAKPTPEKSNQDKPNEP